MNTREYALSQGVSVRTVQRWIENGSLYAERRGRTYFIPDDEPTPPPEPVSDLKAKAPTSSQLEPNDYLTTRGYADYYGVSQRTVQRWIQNGELYAVKVNGHYEIPTEPPTPKELYKPEEIDDTEDEDEERIDPNIFPASALRSKQSAVREDVEIYAEPIPVPYKIFKDLSGLYRVAVLYDIIEANPKEALEE